MSEKEKKKWHAIKLFHQMLLKSRGYSNGIGGTTHVLKKHVLFEMYLLRTIKFIVFTPKYIYRKLNHKALKQMPQSPKQISAYFHMSSKNFIPATSTEFGKPASYPGILL